MTRKTKRPRQSAPIDSLGLDKFTWERALTKDKALASTTRLVLLVLGVRMDNKPDHTGSRKCFPSMATLAEETGLTQRAVWKHIDIARAAGWIKVVEHAATKGEHAATKGWRRFEYFPSLPDGDERGSSRSTESDAQAAMVTNVVHDGDEPGADGDERDDIMVTNHVRTTRPYTRPLPINTKGAGAPKAVDKNGKRNQRGLQGIGGLLSPISEKPVCQEASAPLESEFPYFESGSVLDLAAKTIGRIPSYNVRKATLELRRQIEARGQEAVEARCRTAPTDPIKCWAHVRQRDS